MLSREALLESKARPGCVCFTILKSCGSMRCDLTRLPTNTVRYRMIAVATHGHTLMHETWMDET
jgi:hypothetical protein